MTHRNETYEDLIFRGKNKRYGAYLLRMYYRYHVLIGFFFGAFMISSAVLIPFYQFHKPEKETKTGSIKTAAPKVIEYSQLSAPPPVELDQPQQPIEIPSEIPQIKTVKFLPPIVKSDEEIEEEELIPTQEELEKTNIGKENIEGTDSLVNYIPANVEIRRPEGDEGGTATKKREKPAQTVSQKTPENLDPKIFDFTEKSPSFPGGPLALRKYLKENIIYPMEAREAHIEGKVVLQMVIEPDGKVTNISISRSSWQGFNKEAVRVVSTMPSWVPGEMNGKKVRTRAAIPIEFNLIFD